MKITKSKLKQIIKEELEKVLREQDPSAAMVYKIYACSKSVDASVYQQVSVVLDKPVSQYDKNMLRRHVLTAIRQANRRRQANAKRRGLPEPPKHVLVKGSIRPGVKGQKMIKCLEKYGGGRPSPEEEEEFDPTTPIS